MGVDMFIKIDGITGESKDHKHKDTIDVLAWSWGMSQSGSFHGGGGGGAGKANVQGLSITQHGDKSSPLLMLSCSNGKHIKEALLTVRTAGEYPHEYLKIKLTEEMVAHVSTGDNADEHH